MIYHINFLRNIDFLFDKCHYILIIIILTMSLLKCSEFNRQYNNGTKFVKLTYESENHNGMQYQDGLNVDIEPFLAYNYCKGGIYFCRFDKMEKWLCYGKELRRKTTIFPS